MGSPRSPGMVAAALVALALAACGTLQPRPAPTEPAAQLRSAERWADNASTAETDDAAMRAWINCATDAWQAARAPDTRTFNQAAALAEQCADGFLERALARHGSWHAGRNRVAGIDLLVEFRRPSAYLTAPLDLTLARHVQRGLSGVDHQVVPGFGVPLAVVSRRCKDAPLCRLLPPEGVGRAGTAWIEFDPATDALPRLVVADPFTVRVADIHGRGRALAMDTSAAWMHTAAKARLTRIGILGLFGGREVGRRAGVYLMEDYDPAKQPVVMIHGLASNPTIWGELTNAIWADPALRARYQVWHVVYASNAPLLVARRRVQNYLDDAWHLLDPDGDDAARSGIVLVGHSMGGVISRLLCADSGDALWNAAFLQPVEALRATDSDRKLLNRIYHFSAYPGVRRAIFMASPHRGSPSAESWYGELLRVLVGRRVPEIRTLQKVAQANIEAVRPELREAYETGAVNSVSTLKTSQPVTLAGESLMPKPGIAYHTIAGSLPGKEPPGDGVVPLQSAMLDGAESSLVIEAGHDLQDDAPAVAEVVRILRAAIAPVDAGR